MEAADDAGAAAGDLAQLLHRFEGDPAFRHDLLEKKAFGEGAAEVLPHVARDPLALRERHVGEGEGEIVKRALLAAEAGSDQAPGRARFARGGLERTHGNRALNQPESGIFQPMAQFCREAHHSASQSARGPKAPDCADVAALSRRAAKRQGGGNRASVARAISP